jgi:hypothetical protein
VTDLCWPHVTSTKHRSLTNAFEASNGLLLVCQPNRTSYIITTFQYKFLRSVGLYNGSSVTVILACALSQEMEGRTDGRTDCLLVGIRVISSPSWYWFRLYVAESSMLYIYRFCCCCRYKSSCFILIIFTGKNSSLILSGYAYPKYMGLETLFLIFLRSLLHIWSVPSVSIVKPTWCTFYSVY